MGEGMNTLTGAAIDQSPRRDCLSIAKATSVMFRRLMEYFDPDEADTWLNTEHPDLDGATPISIIAAERGGEVFAIIDSLDGEDFI